MINSISPTSGSLLGGRVVTIKGENFLKGNLDNNVFMNFGSKSIPSVILTSSET